MTAIAPVASDFYMPSIDQYMALAEAMHDERDDCNANYAVPFSECGAREADIDDAVAVLTGLHQADWTLVRKPAGAVEMGL